MTSTTPLRPLSNNLQERAAAELNEDPDKTDEYLEHIEEWLKKQPHLKAKTDRQYFLNFLRSAKFSLQRTKEKLDYFYTMKSASPDVYCNKDPYLPELELILKQGVFTIATERATEAAAPTVYIIRWGKSNPETMSFVNLLKASLMYLDVSLEDDDNLSVCGCYIIQDLKDLPLGYIKQLTPSICKKTMLSVWKMYPFRLKGILFFNVPKTYVVFINMFTRFLPEKFSKRVAIFNEDQMDQLYTYIPKEHLPKDYGGADKSLDELTADWYQRMVKLREWFLEDDRYKSDESKRVEESPAYENVFGADGSFRKLNID